MQKAGSGSHNTQTVLKPEPYKIDESAVPVVLSICEHIAHCAGYDVDRPCLHRLIVCIYENDENEYGVWLTVHAEEMYGGVLKQIPTGLRISFWQGYEPYDQPKKWMKAKLFIDDEYGNHHWYVDPQKFIEKLEAAIEYMKSLGI